MKLKALLAASAIAVVAAAFSDPSYARKGGNNGEAPPAQAEDVARQWGNDGERGERRRGDRGDGGDRGQGGQNVQAPPGNYQGQQGGYRPPPPPPQPGADAQRYGGGYGQRHRDRDWGRDRHRDRDRDDRRRDRFRDGAAVVLGLGVLGALASRPHYEDPYYGDDRYPPPPPQGYGPGYYDAYPNAPYHPPGPYADGYGPPGSGVIRCSSGDYRTQWCQIPQGARVQIRRKISSASCDYGRDWGVGRGAIWVANGCRAEFVIY